MNWILRKKKDKRARNKLKGLLPDLKEVLENLSPTVNKEEGYAIIQKKLGLTAEETQTLMKMWYSLPKS